MSMEEDYNKIFRYCYYRIRDRQTAEDLTQETFLRFLNSAPEDLHNGTSYLYTIARNLCIDESRKHRTYQLPQDYELSDGGKFSDQLTDDLYINEILDGLTDEERELIVLRYVNEEPLSLICEGMQISRFALYRKLKNITGKLREKMERGGYV